jgi:hypothetical protein
MRRRRSLFGDQADLTFETRTVAINRFARPADFREYPARVAGSDAAIDALAGEFQDAAGRCHGSTCSQSASAATDDAHPIDGVGNRRGATW